MFNKNISAGPLISKKLTENGLFLYSANGYFEIVVFSDSIIRVTFTKNGRKPIDFSYAVKSKPIKCNINIEEKNETIVISTNLIKLVINCKPIRLSFYDKNDRILNEEHKSFGTSYIAEQITSYRKLQKDERFIGLGEKTGDLDRFGTAYTNWNTDHFAYPINADPLYISIPFYIGIIKKKAYGIFLDDPSKTVFNFGASNNRFSYFSTEFGSMRYYFIHDTSIRQIIEAYTWLTGRLKLPPIWSLGYQQCRYSYMNSDDVIRLAKTFKEKRIPCDTIYLDIHHMENYKSFTWNNDNFKNPKKLIQKLKDLGFKVITIINPGVKIENNYDIYESGKKNDVFIKYPDGEDYVAEVWPGYCVFPDFTNPAVRLWWGNLLKKLIDIGIEGFWTDMNEPSCWGQCVPDFIELDYDGIKVLHKYAHNIYGFQMARCTYEGAKRILNNRRPFVLSRSGFSGIQNYSAVWTGNNVASDDHLLLGSRMLNSLGISGIAFTGNDIAGFLGDASSNLYARWLTIGVFTPLFRGHTILNSKNAEPWCFGEKVENIAKNYIKLRYMLLPYIYSTFYECSKTGIPIVRTLAIDYPDDNKIFDLNYQNQYLFGEYFLISPVSSMREISKIYLPIGDWYDFYTDSIHKGKTEVYYETPINKIPIFIKSGAIIPMQNEVGYNSSYISKKLSFHVYKSNSHEKFLYYEDDGISYSNERSNFYIRSIENSKNTIIFGVPRGEYISKYKKFEIIFHGFHFNNRNEIYVNKKKI